MRVKSTPPYPSQLVCTVCSAHKGKRTWDPRLWFLLSNAYFTATRLTRRSWRSALWLRSLPLLAKTYCTNACAYSETVHIGKSPRDNYAGSLGDACPSGLCESTCRFDSTLHPSVVLVRALAVLTALFTFPSSGAFCGAPEPALL
jgi:hypothetical protein